MYISLFSFSFVCHYVVPSLSEDPTPLAESFNPLHFELEADGKREAANKLDLPTAASGGIRKCTFNNLRTNYKLQETIQDT